MAISFKKLVQTFSEMGVNSTKIKNEKIIGQSAWSKIKTGGDVDTKTINKLCKYLNCQPGDIMEYVPDNEE